MLDLFFLKKFAKIELLKSWKEFDLKNYPMGNHPSIKYEITFEKSPKEVFAALKNGVLMKGEYKVTSETENELTISWFSNLLKWEDELVFKLKDSGDKSCTVVGKSRSTNFCPTTCAVCQPCFTSYGTFGDGGKNNEHINEVLALSSLKHEKNLIEKLGLSFIK